MNLTNQSVSGTNEISLQDSLNAAALGIKIKMGATSVAPNENDLVIYVDKQSSSNPSNDRKQYVFNLTDILRYASGEGDEVVQKVALKNNKIVLEAYVNRLIGSDNSVLAEPVVEELDAIDITLFEGTNYIYTNYTDADIIIVYPKDDDLNRLFVNSVIYARHTEACDDFSLDDIYFKDAFTKIGDELNIEVDNLTAKCITSKNNTFSIDNAGNIVANSLTINGTPIGGGLTSSEVVDLIYPVGSIYLSVSSTSPATLFGGTWDRINGYYLYAGDGGNTAGSNTSGGPSTNTTGSTALTIAQMPSHTHTQNPHSHAQNNNTWMNDPAHYDTRPAGSSGFYAGAALVTYYTQNATATNNNTGGGQGHTHTLNSHTHSVTPLRYEVYTWKRTA